MKRRRSTDSSSSLDLFLDTICNAFAGIMFIAILLSIVTQLRSHDSRPNDRRFQSESDLQRLEELVSRVSDLEAAINSLGALAASSASAELPEEEQRLQASLDKLSASTAEHAKLLEELTKIIANNTSIEQELASLDDELERLKQQLQNRSGEFDTLRAERVVAIDLPEVRASNKTNLLFLMKYGNCFSVYDETEINFNKSQVDIEQKASGTFVRPKANAGWDLNKPADAAVLSQFLRKFSTTNRIVTIGVWPDSFGQFADFKKSLIDLGFEYELVPLDAGEGVPVSQSSGQSKVQ